MLQSCVISWVGSHGTLLPRGLPNCNTARSADTPRTPACPLTAAVAASLGQKGEMTDFHELAKNMRPLLQEAKLSSLAVSHFIQPPRHRRSTRCISAPRRRHPQVRAHGRRKKPKRRRETKTSLKHARTAKHTGRVPRGTFYKCASVAATSASAPSSATARRANAEPLPVCLTCLHLDNVAQQLVVVLLRRRYAV